MGEKRDAYRGVTLEGKGPLGRPRHRRKNIQMDKWWALVSMETKLRPP
jgi:hypothetical protein